MNFDGQVIRKIPQESYLKTLNILKSLEINEVMLSGYVTIEEAAFDMEEETKYLGALLDSIGMRPAQHHGLAATYAPIENSQEPVIERLIQEIQYTANLNSPVLVIHPGHYFEPNRWKNHESLSDVYDEEVKHHGIDKVLEVVAQNLREAGSVAEKLGIKIALENLDRFFPMGSAELLPQLIQKADSASVGFCLDSGHAHCCGATSVVEWIEIMRDKLFTTHFHDNRGARLQALGKDEYILPDVIDEHKSPGFGTIPWIDVIAKMREFGYENTINFETVGWPELPEEESYRYAIAFWRTLENLSARQV